MNTERKMSEDENKTSNEEELVNDNEEEVVVETEETKDEAQDLKDQLLRALAEAENIRRRSVREKEDMAKYAISNFAGDLLDVSDNLRRALDSISDEEKEQNAALKNLFSGIEFVEKSLLSAFEKHKIKKIDPLGEAFDHNFHQAIMEIESDYDAGVVAEVLQSGYVLHDRLLRPAMVKVSKGKA